MAKDGTNRGGARAGAGRKKKALTDKVAEGRTGNLKVMPAPADLHGEAMPPIQDFMAGRERLCFARQSDAPAAVCHERFPLDSMRGDHLRVRFPRQAPDHGRGHRLSLCRDEPAVHEASEPDLVSNLPDRERELLRGLPRREPAGRRDGASAPCAARRLRAKEKPRSCGAGGFFKLERIENQCDNGIERPF